MVEKNKPILADCLCCGKKTGYGIPYSICNECRRRINKYLTTKENYENTLMLARDVKHIADFDSGLEDVDLYLNNIGDMLFTIEKQIEWIKNNLVNIQTEVSCRIKEIKEKNRVI